MNIVKMIRQRRALADYAVELIKKFSVTGKC
jgi:hypothetical protein